MASKRARLRYQSSFSKVSELSEALKRAPSVSSRKSLKHEDVLLFFDELPEWRQDNEYILSGYRPTMKSMYKCFQSVTSKHNETAWLVNIWSHVVGALLFASLPVWFFQATYPRYIRAGTADVVVFSTFFFGVAVCFLLSAIFHILCNHSERINVLGNTLDYLGIVLLMWGSTLPSVYYGFYCDPHLQRTYWVLITVLALLCTITTVNPRFRHPTLRPYRAAMYSLLGLSALIFVAHGISLYGFTIQDSRMSLKWMGIMAAFNFTGAAAYACRVPERFYPRRYDIYGAGHQILHFMVILAGIAHLVGLLKAFDHIHSQPDVC